MLRGRLFMSRHRRLLCHEFKALIFMVVLIRTHFYFVECGPCCANGMPIPVEYDSCKSYKGDCGSGFQGVYVGDAGSGYLSKSHVAHLGRENVCGSSNSFCFPSTLTGFLPKEHATESAVLDASAIHSDGTLPAGSTQVGNNSSWSSYHGIFKLLSGRAISCSLKSEEEICDALSVQTSIGNQNCVSPCQGPVHNQKRPSPNLNENSEMVKSGFIDGSLSSHIEVSPPLLDWGQKYLYTPSVAFVSVANTHHDRMLYLYEPFSTNPQFYPCNFSEVLLAPGEVASVCFVFLPTWLGMSSGHLILQTSFGGFLILAKGFAVESPYVVQPLVGFEISSSGRWSKTLSLFNPFNETLSVEEVAACISVSLGNASHSAKAMCRVESLQSSDEHRLMNTEEWLGVKGSHVNSPGLAIRPHGSWDISPHSTETIIEMDFSYIFAGKMFGAFCMELLRSSQEQPDTIIVPLEADLGSQSTIRLVDSVPVSVETRGFCDGSETTVIALLLRNGAPDLLKVIKISLMGEDTKHFQVKFMEGLLLFPGTVTQVAMISYIVPEIGLHHSPSEIPNMNFNCRLMIVTNDSSSPQIEVLCTDIVNVCSKLDSDHEYGQSTGKAEYRNPATGSLGGSVQSPLHIKAIGAVEPDELVLGNWKSQGTACGLSVLEDREILFPTVQVGTHHSKWISVKNPSHEPVVMQLILNSGEIIDGCRASAELLQPSSSTSLVHSERTSPTKYGFSMAKTAITEAYVHPHETVSFGPILFHPSNRCGWRSSALIRNNLSGVEWLPLRAFGGSFSLVLFEGSERVESLEFKFNFPSPLNFSPDIFYHLEEAKDTCSQPLSKELYAKNNGDLPLEVRRIEVSGTECGLDGFVVHTCNGFALEPGESIKLLISYQADFSAVKVQRDLELALGTGILVIPMKASHPLRMFNLCNKSVFWMRVKKFSYVIFAAFLIFVAFICVIPQLMVLGSQDYFLKGGKGLSSPSTGQVGKPSQGHHNPKNSNKFSVSSKVNGLLRSFREKEPLTIKPINSDPDGQGFALEHGISAQHVKQTMGNQRESNDLMDAQNEIAFGSCALPDSSTVETSDIWEAPKDGKLRIRIEKDKRRRRRKKKASGTGLTGVFEVSSSQSGNSTPSSPLSPVTSVTPKRLWTVSSDSAKYVEARDKFVQVAERGCEKSSGIKSACRANIFEPEVSMKYSKENTIFLTQEKPSEPRKSAGKADIFPSASCPCSSRSATSLACPSPFMGTTAIAPHARAPGSKLYNQKTVETEEKMGPDDQFKYDIWGDHLFGLHLVDRSKEVSAMTSRVTESHSDSFFVRGPQTLMRKSQLESVSCSYAEP
ncbi:uncharacterized protein LOC127804600 isoform X2 [Diospyros lotus]|uniref:uncharacterized protein LOC127804600 isoform X2 n=1 Tax=Diospyros lotus TaxID=55363 RepID=UPI00225B7025|nr:uncharacterized protein LOC127804600 isoform X2 [Diospyros lotus]